MYYSSVFNKQELLNKQMNSLKSIKDERSFVVLDQTHQALKIIQREKRPAKLEISELDCARWPLGKILPIVREEVHQLKPNAVLLLRNCDEQVMNEFHKLCSPTYFITHYCQRHRTFAVTFALTG